jgi:NADH dehydrogenase (ubiquinone) 1 alpha subcomplex subunit 6
LLHHSWKLNKFVFILVEKLNVNKTEDQCKEKLKEVFVKNKEVGDVRVIDMLVIKGQMELKEITMQWKQKCHIMNYWQETVEPKPQDFLSKFTSGSN